MTIVPEGLRSDRDPFVDRIYAPQHDCPHGWGERCECKLPRYRGLYVVPILCEDGRTRHIVARMRMVHDGGMIELHDPVSDEVVGSMGIHTMWAEAQALEDWTPGRVRGFCIKMRRGRRYHR